MVKKSLGPELPIPSMVLVVPLVSALFCTEGNFSLNLCSTVDIFHITSHKESSYCKFLEFLIDLYTLCSLESKNHYANSLVVTFN